MPEQVNLLFRNEALRYRGDRLHGSVSVATPLAWQLIGYLFVAALFVVVLFLSLATYARVETVEGAIVSDRGVATIVPSRAGVVQALAISEGASVKAGQLLARVRSEESLIGGDTATAQIRRSLRGQEEQLRNQALSLRRSAGADLGGLREEERGIGEELNSLDAQIAEQAQLIASAQIDLARAREIAERGFVSRHDIENREATLGTRRQQLAQLQQQRASKRARRAQLNRNMVEANASSDAQVAAIERSRAALLPQLAEANLAQGYDIVAPVRGVVTGLTGSIGQAVSTDRQLMMVVPAGARADAELYVPTAAAGFLRNGQEVRLAVDAYPFQSFGTIPAHIQDIAGAAVSRQSQRGPVPVYLVRTRLDQPWIEAFGRRQTLLPGMTLTARIVTERHSLLEWLFEPIFAVRGR